MYSHSQTRTDTRTDFSKIYSLVPPGKFQYTVCELHICAMSDCTMTSSIHILSSSLFTIYAISYSVNRDIETAITGIINKQGINVMILKTLSHCIIFRNVVLS